MENEFVVPRSAILFAASDPGSAPPLALPASSYHQHIGLPLVHKANSRQLSFVHRNCGSTTVEATGGELVFLLDEDEVPELLRTDGAARSSCEASELSLQYTV